MDRPAPAIDNQQDSHTRRGYIVCYADAWQRIFESIQVTSTVAFLSYIGPHGLRITWFGHTTGRFLKDLVEGLVYGLVTGDFSAGSGPGAAIGVRAGL